MKQIPNEQNIYFSLFTASCHVFDFLYQAQKKDINVKNLTKNTKNLDFAYFLQNLVFKYVCQDNYRNL
jgi:hypothetical protein